MIDKGAQCLSTNSSHIWPKVLHWIQVRQIHPPLVWKGAFCSKLLNIHSKQADFHTFYFLEEQHHLKRQNHCVRKHGFVTLHQGLYHLFWGPLYLSMWWGSNWKSYIQSWSHLGLIWVVSWIILFWEKLQKALLHLQFFIHRRYHSHNQSLCSWNL